MCLGSPTNVKNFASALITVWALIFLRGIASGSPVTIHIIVNRYVFPDLVLGKGPMQSTSIRLNGSSTGGIGFSRATGVSSRVFQPFDRYGKLCKA